MHISRENIDELNSVITLKITEEDYTQKVDDVLRDYKKKARIDGFRPGMVPFGMIKKLYYKPVLVEEINKLVGEKLLEYIREEKIRILGEPLPHKDQEPDIDFDKDKEFVFSFDIGLYPEISINISENDEIPYYKIKLEDDAVNNTIEEIAYRHGNMEQTDEITGVEEIKGNVFQSDESGNAIENGISVTDVNLYLDLIENKDSIELFKTKKRGEKVTFDIKTLIPDNNKIKSFLKIPNEENVEFEGFYTLEITEITMFVKHEINQELFDKIYGEGKVKSVEEFNEKIKEEITNRYKQESEYRFTVDARDYYLNKSVISLPVDFLKRWLIETQENLTKEQLDKDFSDYKEDFKWQIIKDQIIKVNEIKVSEQEMLEFAILSARSQFYQYRMYDIPEEYLEKYAREQLAKPDSSKALHEQRLNEKVFELIRETVKAKEEEVSMEEFRKLYDK